MPTWFYRLGLVLGISVLLALQYRFWVGEGSYAHIHAVEKEIQKHKIENTQLKKRNAILQARIDGLKNSHEAIEASARYDLGLIKEGEFFYRLPEIKQPHPYSTKPLVNSVPVEGGH